MRYIALVTASMLIGSRALPAAPVNHYALTIYNTAQGNQDALFNAAADIGNPPGGYAIVLDVRSFELQSGANGVSVDNISRWLDPGAIDVRALSAGVTVTSRHFDAATLSLATLARREIGQHVVVVPDATGAGPASGKLLSTDGGMTLLQADGRVTTVTRFGRITFPNLPSGLASTPSLGWNASARHAGSGKFRIVYPTRGLAWRAEYRARLHAAKPCMAEFEASAEIANRSGADFPGARITLIAGQPNILAAPRQARPVMMAKAMNRPGAQASGYAGDYHRYTVEMPLDLRDGIIQRVALMPTQRIDCERRYLFEAVGLRAHPGMRPVTQRDYALNDTQPVQSSLIFKAAHALPRGRIRVSGNGKNGEPEFIGEDRIDDTPAGEAVDVALGTAFDLRGSRSQTDFHIDDGARTIDESFSIRLLNAGERDRTVMVREHLYRWTQWQIVRSSRGYRKRDADTVDFDVTVPANGHASVTYTVRYQWPARPN